MLRDLRQQWPQIARLLPELPALAHGVLRGMNEENQAPRASFDEIDSLRQEFRSSQRRFSSILVGCVLLLVATTLAVVAEPAHSIELNLVSGLVGAGGVLLVVFGWFAGQRRNSP